ncbi:MAG TPA: hypothetical protein VHN37_00475 [Actinomycetota bacterium]|nr:hypothetical protein [Actinomycetota bacterium]
MPAKRTENSALGGAVFFDKARRFAAAGLVLAGLCTIAGSFLDWAVITERRVAENVDFGEEAGDIEAEQGEPFRGVDDRDGRLTLAGGVALVGLAVALVVRKTTGVAWTAFWVSLAIGGIAFADYRTVSENESAPRGILLRHEVGVEASPGTGLAIVAAGGMLGVISSVGGVAATPREG